VRKGFRSSRFSFLDAYRAVLSEKLVGRVLPEEVMETVVMGEEVHGCPLVDVCCCRVLVPRAAIAAYGSGLCDTILTVGSNLWCGGLQRGTFLHIKYAPTVIE
jgi:hypothetical protein